ncbi:MAG: DinB family protein [Terriglobales bacterium]
MKSLLWFAAALALCCPLAFSQSSNPMARDLNRQLTLVENEVVPAAEAMPADKYDFAPSDTMGNFKGVRTFAQEVKHIAASNYLMGAAVLGTDPPVKYEDNGPASIQGKDAIVKFLKDSFAYAHHAIDSVNPENALKPPGNGHRNTRLFEAAEIPVHTNDHYGQMVEYLRMNGIVPPASVGSAPANPGKHE